MYHRLQVAGGPTSASASAQQNGRTGEPGSAPVDPEKRGRPGHPCISELTALSVRRLLKNLPVGVIVVRPALPLAKRLLGSSLARVKCCLWCFQAMCEPTAVLFLCLVILCLHQDKHNPAKMELWCMRQRGTVPAAVGSGAGS